MSDTSKAPQATVTRRRQRAARVTTLLSVLACSGAALVAAGSPAAASPISTPSYTISANIHDTMSRTTAGGLGRADSGGTWANTPASMFSVSGGSAHIKPIARGHYVRATLTGVHGDERLQAAFKLPKMPSSGSVYTALEFRKQHNGSVYRARVQVTSSGKMVVGFSRTRSNTRVDLGSRVLVPGTAKAGQTILVEGMVAGSSSVLLRARAWVSGTSAPGWQAAATDKSSLRLPSTGYVGLFLTSDARTATAVDVGNFDGWSLRPATSHPTPVPTPPAPSSGKPGANNTGVPAGKTLKQYNANLTVTKAGATYDGLDIHGFVTIQAPNVTIKNSVIRGGVAGTSSTALVRDLDSRGTGFVLQDSTLVPAHPSVAIDGVMGANYTLNRVEIHGTVDGAKIFGNNASIYNSWIHGLVTYAHDPYQSGGQTHNDGVQILSGKSIHISGNAIEGGSNSAVQITQDHGAVSSLAFTSNWVDGGACSVNVADKPLASMGGITVSSNQFGHTSQYKNCAIIVSAGVSMSHPGNTWMGTNQAVAVTPRS